MKINSSKLSNAKILKKELRKCIKHVIGGHPDVEYIKVKLTITYLKGTELNKDIPLCDDYIINIKSKYKKEQNYFISNMVESINKLQKDKDITIHYLKWEEKIVKKRHIKQFVLVDKT